MLNPTTKTADIPEGIKSVIRANDSLRVRAMFDMFSGRHCCRCVSMQFCFRSDAFGNSFMDSDAAGIEGLSTFVARLQRRFWFDVAKGKLQLNPRRIFRPLAAPQQTTQSAELKLM